MARQMHGGRTFTTAPGILAVVVAAQRCRYLRLLQLRPGCSAFRGTAAWSRGPGVLPHPLWFFLLRQSVLAKTDVPIGMDIG